MEILPELVYTDSIATTINIIDITKYLLQVLCKQFKHIVGISVPAYYLHWICSFEKERKTLQQQLINERKST